jgi:hypothetical protein
MKGKWAAGIPPRNLTWVLPDRLAASERPGGQTHSHRKVRRQEEIIWLRENGFTVVVSLLAAPQNLAAYSELGVRWSHHPIPSAGDQRSALVALYTELATHQAASEVLLLHDDELGDRTIGVVAGYLVWVGRLPDAPSAMSVVERLFGRPLGPEGRALTVTASELKKAT